VHLGHVHNCDGVFGGCERFEASVSCQQTNDADEKAAFTSFVEVVLCKEKLGDLVAQWRRRLGLSFSWFADALFAKQAANVGKHILPFFDSYLVEALRENGGAFFYGLFFWYLNDPANVGRDLGSGESSDFDFESAVDNSEGRFTFVVKV
jgi:hypothetical protein